MTVFALDPGAERMGWAVLGSGPTYIDSGIDGLPRGSAKYQDYRLELIAHWTAAMDEYLHAYAPTIVVNEVIPTRGFNDASQSLLAATALTTAQAIATFRGYKCSQIGATTVKARIGGSNKATKVKVRNGVIALLPELEGRRKDWTKVFDESDAIAVGLSYLGYNNSN